MHEPNPISLAAKASDEPVFREVGVGSWSQTHPDEPRPDDPQSSTYDSRFDSELLDNGDRRNVLDRYRYWSVNAIKDDLDKRGRHGFDVAVENWTHDFNIGSMVRTANAFAAGHVYIVGPHKWNRKGALMTELYQHVESRPTIEDLITSWRADIASEIAAWEEQLSAISESAISESDNTGATTSMQPAEAPLSSPSSSSSLQSQSSQPSSLSSPSPLSSPSSPPNEGSTTLSDTAVPALSRDDINKQLRTLREAKVIALDIIPGAVPIETYRFPERCLMLFGAEGPGLSHKAVEMADDVVYISQFGSVRSINAGAAAAVSMHCWISQHAAIV